MNLRSLTRRLALRIPRVRRYYDYVNQLSAEHSAAVQELAKLKAHAGTVVQASKQESGSWTDQDDLELQLYAIRADYQRTIRTSDRLRTHMGEMTKERHALGQRLVECEAEKKRLAEAVASQQELHRLGGLAFDKLSRIDADLTHLRHRLGDANKDDIASRSVQELYLDLLESNLTGQLCERAAEASSDGRIRKSGIERTPVIRNLRRLTEAVLRTGIPGGLVAMETDGRAASIYMCGILAAHGDADRKIWAVDVRVEDQPAGLRGKSSLASEEMRQQLSGYGLPEHRAVFMSGSHDDVVAKLEPEQVAILYLDGEAVLSAPEMFEVLYRKLEAGGYVIVGGKEPGRYRPAVEEFRTKAHARGALQDMEGAGFYWQKEC